MMTNAIYKKVRRLVSVVGKKCSECGCTNSLQRHHPDHTKPMYVVVLCIACHGRVSAKERWKGRTADTACRWCGRTFTKTRSRQTACSRSCGNKAAWSLRKGSQ